MDRTSLSRHTSAEICRRNAWIPGTLLQGEATIVEDNGEDLKLTDAGEVMSNPIRRRIVSHRIEITAVGVRQILARYVQVDGVALEGLLDEFIVDLHARDWQAVG